MIPWMFEVARILIAFRFWLLTFTRSERVALGSAFLVLVGVIGEYLVELDAIEKKEKLKTRLKRVSMALLVIGLSGDVLGIVMSQAEMAAIAKVVGDAASSAQKAGVNAQEAKAHADAANTVAGEAQLKADGAKRDADAAGVRANAVSQKADQIDSQLAATQYAFSMRTLPTLASRDKLIEQLKHFKGKTVAVRSYRYMGDVDGFRVCKIVIDLARSAGMNPVDQCSTLVPGDSPGTGIQVCGPNDQEMLSLSKALTPLDMSTTCPMGNAAHLPGLQVSVGSKALIGVGSTFQPEDAKKRGAAVKKSNPSSKP